MVQLQRLLEHACYTFGQREMQNTLRERGWDCAEAAELHSWMEEFLYRYKTFQTESSSTLEKLFKSVSGIRNTAVCRIRIQPSEIRKFLADAELLLRILKVNGCFEVAKELRLRVEEILIVLDQDTRSMRARAEKELAEIAAERAKLDQLEKAAKVKLHEGIWDCQVLAGSKAM